MWPFWLLFLVPAMIALGQRSAYVKLSVRWPAVWWLIFMLMVLMIGLRYEVGGDWTTYITYLDKAADEGFFGNLLLSDPAYMLLNKLAFELGQGVYFVNFLGAIIFCYGLIAFCRQQSRPWLALTVAIPYLVVVVAMGYTRQAIAIGLAMLALVALADKRLYRYFVLMVLAAMFHKTAIIMLPLVAFSSASNRWWRYLLTVIILISSYVLLVQDATDHLVTNYILAEYDSQGATIRVAMNALPALLFLLFERRFGLPEDQRKFWRVMALSGLVFVPLLVLSPSSTAVDRLALYWIPLQLFVYSRLPEALGRPGRPNFIWVLTIVGLYAAILAVWLLFATHAQYWLPYQFYPWIWATGMGSGY